ncbi:MAG: PilZ domain-containing protein [Spirochaetaceae bacterium]|jgi:hypothetical protein|nr:PilZ domain-containing protein [Spirochaetaceae bacterium]
MATPVKHVERDFFLNALCTEQIPLTYLRNRVKYALTIEKTDKNTVSLKAEQVIKGLEPKNKVTFAFMYKNIRFSFSSVVSAVQDEYITLPMPEALYKNLDRSYARVMLPEDLTIECRYTDEGYILPFPTLTAGESPYTEKPEQDSQTDDFDAALARMASWADRYADALDLISFKEKKPDTIEEALVSEHGKTLFLPQVLNGLPQEDNGMAVITADDYKAYLKNHQPEIKDPDEALKQFISDKQNKNLGADLWLPLYFQDYIIGCIHLSQTSASAHLPFDESVLRTARQFAVDLVAAMKASGYFAAGYLKNKLIPGKIVNISASGFCFAYSSSPFSAALRVAGDIAVRLSATNRIINATAKIVRQYQNREIWFLGCQFVGMIPEDLRFLYESLYGEQFADTGGVLF